MKSFANDSFWVEYQFATDRNAKAWNFRSALLHSSDKQRLQFSSVQVMIMADSLQLQVDYFLAFAGIVSALKSTVVKIHSAEVSLANGGFKNFSTVPARSRVSCYTRCASEDLCLGFSFDRNTSLCCLLWNLDFTPGDQSPLCPSNLISTIQPLSKIY